MGLCVVCRRQRRLVEGEEQRRDVLSVSRETKEPWKLLLRWVESDEQAARIREQREHLQLGCEFVPHGHS